MTIAIVCWYVLVSGVQVCSSPIPLEQAVRIALSEPSSGQSHGTVWREGSKVYHSWTDRLQTR